VCAVPWYWPLRRFLIDASATRAAAVPNDSTWVTSIPIICDVRDPSERGAGHRWHDGGIERPYCETDRSVTAVACLCVKEHDEATDSRSWCHSSRSSPRRAVSVQFRLNLERSSSSSSAAPSPSTANPRAGSSQVPASSAPVRSATARGRSIRSGQGTDGVRSRQRVTHHVRVEDRCRLAAEMQHTTDRDSPAPGAALCRNVSPSRRSCTVQLK